MFNKLIFENIKAGSGSMDFVTGLTVLETNKQNAQPSILSSFAVLAGNASATTVLAEPPTAGKITGEFTNISESMWSIAENHGCQRADTLAITRTFDTSGSITSSVNGVSITNVQADNMCDRLFEIYGMGMQNSILDSSKHANILDRVAKNYDKISAYKNAFRELAKSSKMIALLSADEADRNRQIEVLRKETEEIESANLQSGEFENLSDMLQLLQNEQKILDSLSKILGFVDEKSNAVNSVQSAAQEANVLAEKIGGQHYQIQNIANALKNQLQALKLTEAYTKEQIKNISEATEGKNLKDAEDRLALITELSDRYGGSVDSAIEYAEQAWMQLTDVEFGAEHLEKLQKNEGALLLNVSNAATDLTKSRLEAFDTLCALFRQVISALNMPNFKIHLNHEIVSPGANGRDKIEMLMSVAGGEAKSAASFATIDNPQYAGLTSIGALLSTVGMPTVFYSDVDSNLDETSAAAMANLIKMSAASQQIICVASNKYFIDVADSVM